MVFMPLFLHVQLIDCGLTHVWQLFVYMYGSLQLGLLAHYNYRNAYYHQNYLFDELIMCILQIVTLTAVEKAMGTKLP